MKKNLTTVFIGNTFYSASKYLLLVLINQLLDTVYAGYYAYSMALIAPIFLFLRMSIRTYIATNDKEEFPTIYYLYFILINNFIGMFVLYLYVSLINIEDYLLILLPIYAIFFSFEGIYEVSYGLYQRNNQFQYISLSKIIRAVLHVVLFGITVYSTRLLHLGILVVILFDPIFYIIWEFKKTFKNRNSYTGSILKAYKLWLLESFPLGISVSLDSFLTNIPKYFLESFVSISSVGYYTSIVYIIQLGQMLITAINQTVISNLSTAFFNNNNYYVILKNKLVRLNGLIGILMIIGGFLFGEQLLVLLYGPSYIGTQNILTIILIAGFFWYVASAVHIAISATRQFKKRLYTLILNIIITFILAYLLIPTFGIWGAAVTLLSNYIIKLIISSITLTNIENSFYQKV